MFNESQIGAISHYLGPAIILAGPGSGKTTVITHRIKNLIQKHNVAPEKIMVVTFTKAAAVHMEQRFLKVIDADSDMPKKTYTVTFGTFHSIYYKVLRHTYNYKGDNVISENQRFDIIKEIAVRIKVDVPSLQEFIQNVSSEISNVKGNMLDVEKIHPTCCAKADFQKLLEGYDKELKSLGKMDFDDILVQCYELLKNNRRILEEWQQVYDFILIDEFQDINKIQYEIIKLLSFPKNNIFIVGDDDQSIYGFRGAKPEIMQQFLEDYPYAKNILLNINYRCNENIVKWSHNLITNNSNRFKKEIKAINDVKERSEVKQFKNQQEELNYVIAKIKGYIENGIKPEEIAILVRNNNQIPIITKSLADVNIITKSKNKRNYLYESHIAKDIISYIKAALNYENLPISKNEDLIRVINKPTRLISRQIIAESKMDWNRLKKAYQETPIIEHINKLLFDLKIINMATPYGAVIYIRNGVGYDNYLKEHIKEKKIKLSDAIEQLDKLQQEAFHYKSLTEWIEHIEGQKDPQNKLLNNNPGINILTMHGAKGLEFNVVFIIDANQGIVPSSKAIREKDFEEERRVFYVAITRAAKILNIYGIREVLGCQVNMSMFVSEMLGINEN